MKKYLVLFLFITAFLKLEAEIPDTIWTVNCWPGTVNCVKYFPDGTKFVNNAGSYVQIRETTTGKLLNQFIHQSPEIKSIDVTKDGKYVFAAGTGTNYIGMWDVETGEERRFIDDTMYTEIESMSLSPDNKKIVAILINGGNLHWAIIMWDVETGKVLNKIDELYGEWRKVKFFNKSNKFVIDKGLKPCRIFIFDALNFKIITELNNPFNKELYGIRGFDFSDNDEYLAIAHNPGAPDTQSVSIWNLKDYSIFSIINIGYQELSSVRFSDDLKNIYVGSSSFPNAFLYYCNFVGSIINQKYDITNLAKICHCQATCIDAKTISNEEQVMYGGGSGIVLFRNSHTDVTGENFPNNNYELIYPNPSSGNVNISVILTVPDILKISIFSQSGQNIDFSYVKSFDLGQFEIPINVGFLAKGIYFVKIEGKNFFKTFKLIKE